MHRESNPVKGQDVRRARGKPESDGTVAGQGGEPAKGQVVR